MKDQWSLILENKYQHAKNSYKQTRDIHSILGHFKKCFGVTPTSVKNKTTQQSIDLNPLALYLVSTYSKDSIKTIIESFHVSSDEVSFYKDYIQGPSS